jgi:hypothetical protein
MVGLAFALNLAHIGLLTWADYPCAHDAAQMHEMHAVIARKTGITDLNFFSFVYAVSTYKGKNVKKNITSKKTKK